MSASTRVLTRALGGALFAGALLTLAMAGCGSGGPGGSSSTALVPIGAGLRGEAGLKASLYAIGPQATAALAFDSQGRLWLAVAGLDAHPHDGVYLIAKEGGRAVQVISGLKDPLGLAWQGGELYVSSIGRVDAYWDFKGRRFEKHREVLRGPVPGGENNQLIMGPKGRFEMGVTATCDHCTPKSKWSGSIVSFDPAGGEPRLYARAIRAPFGLAILPGTDGLFVTMNQRDDLGARTPGDLLSLVREGENWRFPGCYGQGGVACEGVPQRVAVLDKHAAAGGVVLTEGRLAGSGRAALVAEWQTGKVLRVALHESGPTFKGTPVPFLSGVQNPLALVLAPGGSLLVGDWGTGKIYRID